MAIIRSFTTLEGCRGAPFAAIAMWSQEVIVDSSDIYASVAPGLDGLFILKNLLLLVLISACQA